MFPLKQDLNLSLINMTKGINQLKILTKHISCKCRCNFDGRKCNSDQCWNNCWCESKKHHYVEKIIFGILPNVVVKIENI